MNTLFDNFQKDYNIAISSYERGDYTYFFRNIRPALEWLCKFVVDDQLDGKCKSSDIFDGTKILRRSGSEYMIQNGTRKHINGRQLMETMMNAFMCKRKDVREARYDENLKSLRERMDMYSSCLRRFYSVASAGNHSSTDATDSKRNATKYASILSDFISFLIDEQILSPDNSAKLTSLKLIKVIDAREIETVQAEKQLISQQFRKQKEELDEVRRQLELLKQKREEAIRNSQESMSEKDEQIKQLQDEIDKKKAISSVIIKSKPVTTPVERSNSDLDLADDKIDFDQEDIILAANESSLLVSGCAGSGKSVIAMKKARQLHEHGCDVITIAYTKSLSNYMQSGISADIGRFYHYQQWKNLGAPSADYVIVDEIQDFTADEILEFVQAAKKNFFFFGDTAQSIYAQYKKGVLSMDEISTLVNLKPMVLFTNYRLPRPIAKISQKYVGVNVEPYSDKTYANQSSILPSIVKFNDDEDQIIAIADIIEANKDKTIGIFLTSNAQVLEFCRQLSALDMTFEFKYELHKAKVKAGLTGYEPYNTLNFTNKLPKIMTYHSAKGLQFDIVILPWFKGAKSVDERKELYVAMTRSHSQLIITYKDTLNAPLKSVPTILYKQSL